MQHQPKLNPAQLQALRQQNARQQMPQLAPEQQEKTRQVGPPDTMRPSNSKTDPGLDQLKKLVDPMEWVRQLYGAPEPTPTSQDEHMKDTEKALKQGKQNHTPLDMKKLGEKHDAQDLARARQQFQWFKSEHEKVIHENKKKEQEKQQALAEEEQRKKQEEEQERQAAQSGGDELAGVSK
jgi:hypothetical protein